MKYFIRTIYFILLIFNFACSDDSLVNPIDSELQKNIIGIWKDNVDYTISYYPDHTFVDTLFIFDSLVDTSIIVKKGKYDISNSILNHYEFFIDTLISKNRTDILYWNSPFEITIENGILIRKQLEIFKNVGANRMDIWDKWESKSWFAQFSLNNSSETYNGDLVTKYDFIQDSNLCSFTRQFHNVINNSVFEYSRYYSVSYNPPSLSLSLSTIYYVEFKDQKMYWNYYYPTKDLYKVN